MKRNTSTVNFEPFTDEEEGELSSAPGCMLFFGMILFMAVLTVALVAKFFNSKMF